MEVSAVPEYLPMNVRGVPRNRDTVKAARAGERESAYLEQSATRIRTWRSLRVERPVSGAPLNSSARLKGLKPVHYRRPGCSVPE